MIEEAKDIAQEYVELNNGDVGKAVVALAMDSVRQISVLQAQVQFYYAGCSKAYLREKVNESGPIRIDVPANPITDDWIKTGAEA